MESIRALFTQRNAPLIVAAVAAAAATTYALVSRPVVIKTPYRAASVDAPVNEATAKEQAVLKVRVASDCIACGARGASLWIATRGCWLFPHFADLSRAPYGMSPQARIKDHYDQCSPQYQELWGKHIHHGLWRDGQEHISKEDAQVRVCRVVLYSTNTSYTPPPTHTPGAPRG